VLFRSARAFGQPIVTEVLALANYSAAEEYHQDFFERNPYQGYCMAVAAPKVTKFKKTFARLVRGNTLVLKHLTYIESARSIGASDLTIILRHILPGTLSSIVVYFTMRIGTSIISAASLSFPLSWRTPPVIPVVPV
jgi:hypothetical protein